MSAPAYSFAEGSWAGPRSREHIRPVGPEGLKPGGGVPVPALCGADLARGWDLPGHDVTEATVSLLLEPRAADGRVFLCAKCAEEWRARQ